MPNPYASETITGYNASPPPDDGTIAAGNELEWDKHKSKLGDPLKTAVENIDTKLVSAFGKLAFNDVVQVSADTNLDESHQGQVIVADMATGNVTLPDATSALISSNFFVTVFNQNAVDVTVDSAGGTINGIAAGTGVDLEEDEWGIFVSDGTDWHGLLDQQPAAATFGAGAINGLHISNDATDAQHDVQVGIGHCRDFANGVNLDLGTVITKKIDVDWVAGDNAGGFPSALTLAANTTYAVFVIHKTADGTVDAGFDTSATATNLLADATDYSGYRRVGYVRTDGTSNIRQFFANCDDIFYEYDGIQALEPEHSITNLAAGGQVIDLDEMPDDATLVCHLFMNWTGSGNGNTSGVTSGDDTVTTDPPTNTPLGWYGQTNTGNFIAWGVLQDVPVNANGEIRLYSDATTQDVEVSVRGWRDTRSLG